MMYRRIMLAGSPVLVFGLTAEVAGQEPTACRVERRPVLQLGEACPSSGNSRYSCSIPAASNASTICSGSACFTRGSFASWAMSSGILMSRTRDSGDQDQRRPASSTLLGSGEGGGEAIEGDGLAAQGAGAEDEDQHDLQLAQDLVEGHPGARTFGSALIMVQKAWARAARVTWRCQPVNERPSKWPSPRPVFSSR